MNQINIENIKKHIPFLLTKEKRIHLITQRVNIAKEHNYSLNNFNLDKISTGINLVSNRKGKNIKLSSEEKIQPSFNDPGDKFNVGRWTKEEKYNFLKGMKEYGNDWKMVQKVIKTRSSSQIRSHAQKYFMRLKKKVKSQYKKFNAINLVNYVFNKIKNLNGGKPVTLNQRKRALNVIISNFQNFGKNEIESCNMMVEEAQSTRSKKDDVKYTLFQKGSDINIASEKNSLKNYSNLIDFQNNKFDLCNKKRKNSSSVNKIFEINKVIKDKKSNVFNKTKNKKFNNKNKFNHSIICPIFFDNYNIINNINDNTNNYNISLCNNSINNNNININFNNKENMNFFTNNNFNIKNNNNVCDFTYLDINKFNFSDSLFDIDSNLRKTNDFDNYVDEIVNDSFKSNFIEDNNLSIVEQDNELSIINKIYDLFE